MQTFSQTIASNMTSIAGLLVIILGRFGVNATVEETTLVVGSIMGLIGGIWNWRNRYKKGDITPLGFIKK